MAKVPTIVKAVRVDPRVWAAARDRADDEGTTVNAALVAFLRRYGRRQRPGAPLGG